MLWKTENDMNPYANAPLPTVAQLIEHEKEYQFKRKKITRIVLELLLLAAVVYILFGAVFGIALVDGSSMVPNIPQQSVVFFLRVDKRPQRGNVVIFSAATGKKYLIKRVVAVSGDTVSIGRDGTFRVNGQPDQSAVTVGKATDETSSVSYPLKVPVESVFAVGDNRGNSLDSRQLGVINRRKLTGVALLVIRIP